MTVFLRLDRFFTALALRGEALAGRNSWRLRRWSRAVVAVAHEAFLRGSGLLGWTDVTAEALAAAQATAPKDAPRHPAAERSPGKIAARAGELRGGDVGTESRFHFHCLERVRELVEGYDLVRHPEYLEAAKAVAEEWISRFLFSERVQHAWDDHATALRALVLCRLWAACWASEPNGSPFLRTLLAAIARHGQKLAAHSFYRGDHNHGVTQAYALLAIGLLFPSLPQAAEWARAGCARLEAQTAENVSAAGVHREHSPFYHFYVFRQLADARRLGQAYGLSFSPEFEQRLEAMLAAGAYLLKPNGTLPALGDTSAGSPALATSQDARDFRAPAYLWSSTQGAEGAPPRADSVLLPDSGYAVFRSGWGQQEPVKDERFLVLRLATENSAHIHRDVFSFELYAYGDDLVVDSGGPFAYGDPLRHQYFLSTRAHNTVVVDDADQRIGRATILTWDSSPVRDVLVAEHANFPGVAHRRAVIFVRSRYFLIIDRLVSDRPHRYAQLFHLNPALEVRLRGQSVVTDHTAGGPALQIVPPLAEHLGLHVHHGALSPRQGWVCRGNRVMIPNAVVEYQRVGTTAVFATLIVPERPGARVRVTSGLTGQPFEETTRVRVGIDECWDEIVIPPTGRVTVGGRTE